MFHLSDCHRTLLRNQFKTLYSGSFEVLGDGTFPDPNKCFAWQKYFELKKNEV